MSRSKHAIAAVCLFAALIFFSSQVWPQSPYGDLLKSINKGQQQPPSQAKPPQPPPQAVPQPPQTQKILPPRKATQVSPPSLKGRNIRANLELTVSANGSKSDSSHEENRTSVSSYESTDNIRRTFDGKLTLSLAFEEAPVFPDLTPDQTLLVPIGTFTYYSEEKTTSKRKWKTWEKVMGDYIVHPQKEGSSEQFSDDEHTIRCDGREVYEGASYKTQTSPAMPALGIKEQSTRILDAVAPLQLQEQPDGTMKYSFSVNTMGQCTVSDVTRGSSGSSSDQYNSEDYFTVTIEGTFPKGQKTIQIKPENVDHRFPTEIEIWNKSQPTTIVISGTLSFVSEPGKLQVTPADAPAFSGPDDNDHFLPSSKAYIVKNIGETPIKYSVSKTQAWLQLSDAQGELSPGKSAKVMVTVNESAARNLKQGDYKDNVVFTNATNGRGDTQRVATLSVGEEQTWRVTLTGQETDDVGGKLMYTNVNDKWGNQVVEYGVRFNYKVSAEFTIKKKEGKWTYKNGKIISASVTPVNIFAPDVFFVKETVCRNCNEVSGLAGTSLGGTTDGKTARLFWPHKIANAVVYNKLKLEHNSTEETHKGYSANEFFSDCFFDFAKTHELTLRDGEVGPFKKRRESSVDQFRPKGKDPIDVYHRYFMKRIR